MSKTSRGPIRRDSSKPISTSDQVPGRKGSKLIAQNDESENDRQMKALHARVEVLENHIQSTATENPRPSSSPDKVRAQKERQPKVLNEEDDKDNLIEALNTRIEYIGNNLETLYYSSTEELLQAKEEVKKLHKDILIRQTFIEDIHLEKRKAQTELENMRKQQIIDRGSYEKEIASLKTKLKMAEDSTEQLRGSHEKEIASLKTKLKVAVDSTEQLRGSNEKEIASLKTKLKVAEDSTEQLREQNAKEIVRLKSELEREKENKDRELELYKAKVLEVEDAMNSLRKQNAKEVNQLKLELEAAMCELELKEQEIICLHNENETQEKNLATMKLNNASAIREKTKAIASLEKKIIRKEKLSNDAFMALETATKNETKQLEEEFQKKLEQRDDMINTLLREKAIDKTASPGRDDTGFLKQQLSKANQEIDELKSRLTKLLGMRLNEVNPSIADLSDPNRPTRLAEKYYEIYDNEWTDAFEQMQKLGSTEVAVIADLLEILQNAEKFCGIMAEQYIENLQKAASKLQEKTSTTVITSTKNQFKELHSLKELRKSYAPSLAEEVFALYVEEKKLNFGKTPRVEAYTKSCIRLCWLMSVKDPKIVLDAVKTPTPFDTDRYQPYTKSGKTMEYVVLPTMFLCEGGPILQRGIAQGK